MSEKYCIYHSCFRSFLDAHCDQLKVDCLDWENWDYIAQKEFMYDLDTTYCFAYSVCVYCNSNIKRLHVFKITGHTTASQLYRLWYICQPGCTCAFLYTQYIHPLQQCTHCLWNVQIYKYILHCSSIAIDKVHC